MPRIIIKAKVADASQWEKSFHSNGSLFTGHSLKKPVEFKVTGKNQVVAMFDAEDAEKYLEILNTAEIRDALGIESVQQGTKSSFGFNRNLF